MSIAASANVQSSVGLTKTATRWKWLDRVARQLVERRLDEIRGGEIVVRDSMGSMHLGRKCDDHLLSHIDVRDPRFYRHTMLGGSLSVAESYIRGDWDCDDLTSFFRVFIRDLPSADQLDRGVARLATWFARGYHWLHSNSKSGSRKNIHAHYDLGNEFFSLMLDDTMCYSSAIFADRSTPLVSASTEKMERICRLLDLQPGDHLLEIGTGWGGLAIHAARNFGCRVTTTTISQQQYEFARDKVNREGLSDRIELLQRDYRDLEGRYDKVVSVEMIEAVGYRYFDTFFRQCNRLLKPGGTLALQGIMMPDQRYEQYLRGTDFIQRYIFPGGCLPSLATIAGSVGRVSNLALTKYDDYGWHYAETLRRWRSRFQDNLNAIRTIGYSEAFMRLWNYYLCYCEAAFEEEYIGLAQMSFKKVGVDR